MENPSKYSRNSSARTAFEGKLAHHDDAQPVLSAAQPVLGEELDDSVRFADGADEWHHDLHVGEPHLIP